MRKQLFTLLSFCIAFVISAEFSSKMSSDSEDGEIKEVHNARSDQREQGEISDSDSESEKIQIVKRSSNADTLSQHSTALVENEPNMAMNRVSLMTDVAESLVNRVRRQAARTINIAETTSARIAASDAAARARAIVAANRSKAQAAAARSKAEAAANLARARAAANLAKSQAASQLARSKAEAATAAIHAKAAANSAKAKSDAEAEAARARAEAEAAEARARAAAEAYEAIVRSG